MPLHYGGTVALNSERIETETKILVSVNLLCPNRDCTCRTAYFNSENGDAGGWELKFEVRKVTLFTSNTIVVGIPWRCSCCHQEYFTPIEIPGL